MFARNCVHHEHIADGGDVYIQDTAQSAIVGCYFSGIFLMFLLTF